MKNVREMDQHDIQREEAALVQDLVALAPYRGAGYPEVDDAYRAMRQRRVDLRDEFKIRLAIKRAK